MSTEEILHIENLILKNSDDARLVDGISLTLTKGEILGLVGESGSGKSLTLRSIIGLLPDGVNREADRFEISGRCAMIFQNPLRSLDPLCPVFRQLTEVVRFNQHVDKNKAREIALGLLKQLSLPEELAVHDRIPSRLSGGQCQRILIAMALACRPDILLCDEPTTALDVTVQKQTIDLIGSLQKELGFSVIFVTHNLAVASGLCSRICVMQNGRIVEEGETSAVLHDPKQDYTKKLLASILPVPAHEAKGGMQ